jgi:Zn-dependent protease with chaperone function
MRRSARVILHAGLLAGLVVGAVAGVVVLAGYLVMLVVTALGGMPVPAPSPARIIFGIVMVLLWGTVILAGLGALRRQFRRSAELARWVTANTTTPGSRLAAAAALATAPDRVDQVTDDAPYAFTHGIWHPRIVVSTGLVEVTTHDELVAVLRHEDHHLRHRDPLTVLVARTWSAAFFLVPLVGAMLQRVLDRQELKADRAAVDSCGISPVAGALLKAVGQPATPGGALAAMSGPALLEARVTQLETGATPRLPATLNRSAPASHPESHCRAREPARPHPRRAVRRAALPGLPRGGHVLPDLTTIYL